jgi:hypothetical protein
MTIQTREINDAATGKVYAWDGLSTDPLPTGALILHPQTNAVFDAREGRTFGELPASGIAVPRTTWYGPLDDVKVVGYLLGPDGCVPIYEPRSPHAPRKNRRTQPDAVDHPQPDKPRRNWRTRKAARAASAPELSDAEHRGSGEPE